MSVDIQKISMFGFCLEKLDKTSRKDWDKSIFEPIWRDVEDPDPENLSTWTDGLYIVTDCMCGDYIYIGYGLQHMRRTETIEDLENKLKILINTEFRPKYDLSICKPLIIEYKEFDHAS